MCVGVPMRIEETRPGAAVCEGRGERRLVDTLLVADLVQAFRRVQAERMRDVPILNHDLEVEAVGFRAWNGYRLGVLITPWFMSLLLLPAENDPWTGLRIGETRTYAFPSGRYQFLLGAHDEIGRYLSCSLFSPVFEFSGQESAVATAKAVMELLFETPSCDQAFSQTPASTKNASTDKPRRLSRRDLLRGAFGGGPQ
jgi:[NiFe] hydrogenase assembly HybE family chaperone